MMYFDFTWVGGCVIVTVLCPSTVISTTLISFHSIAVDQSTEIISQLNYNQMDFHTFRVNPLHGIFLFSVRQWLQKCTSSEGTLTHTQFDARVSLSLSLSQAGVCVCAH